MSTFYKPCQYNSETKQQLWLSAVGDIHESICGCETPFAHLLDSIFPEDHRDRHKTIQQIIDRDRQECQASGGGEEINLGQVPGLKEEKDIGEKEENYIEDEDLTNLLDAAAFAAADER